MGIFLKPLSHYRDFGLRVVAITRHVSYGTRANVFACRGDVSGCGKYSASSGENFKRFKILVRAFISYEYRADVVEVSHKLVQTSCISRHFSSLLAV